MRRYTIRIGEQAYEVDVGDTAADCFTVAVQGQTFEVVLADQRDLAVASITPQLAGSVTAAASQRAPASAAAPARALKAGPAAKAATAAGAGHTLAAPMPGVILRVLVAKGTHVQRGQDVVVLEAMKMENIVRAPREGVVAEVCVEAGAQVAHGQALVRFEGAGA
jgi:biotin carboxyl carrier protein